MTHSHPVASVTNTWEHITIWCLNHDEPVEMMVLTNTEQIKTPFYACTKNNDKEKCANRMNLDDYQGVVLKFLDMIAEDSFSDFTNHSFTYKGSRQKLFVKVINCPPETFSMVIPSMTLR